MEKKHKIIIVALIIVIIALIAGLAMMLGGGNVNVSSDTVKDGMMVYNFDSVFTMQVPEGTIFNKSWGTNEDEISFGDVMNYLDKNKKFAVHYSTSPLITKNFSDFSMDMMNSSGNASVSYDGDLIVLEKTSKKSDFGDYGNVKFSKAVAIQNDDLFVTVYGSNLTEIKEMVNTIKIRGD